MQKNYKKITPEFCEENTLIFIPKNEDEAKHIQERLFRMGFSWVNNESLGPHFQNAGMCIRNKIVVSDGKIRIKPTSADWSNGYICNVSQLPDTNEPVTPATGRIARKRARTSGEQTAKAAQPRKRRPVNEELLEEWLKELDALIGLRQAKLDLRECIALARINLLEEEMGIQDDEPFSLHMAFTGPPGTGKTTVAGITAKILYALGLIDKPKAVEASRDNIVGEHIGDTEKNMKKLIEQALDGILFIDEAYSLSSDDSKRDFGHKAIDILNNSMKKLRDRLVVIVAGYPEPMEEFMTSNPGLASRFPTYVSYEEYSMKELGDIMDMMLQKRSRTMTPEAHDYAMQLLEKDKEEKERKKEPFSNARIVRNLVDKLKKVHARHMMDEGKLGKDHGGLSDDDYRKELTTYTLQDVMEVSLKGIEIKKPGTRIGFARQAQPQRAMAMTA